MDRNQHSRNSMNPFEHGSQRNDMSHRREPSRDSFMEPRHNDRRFDTRMPQPERRNPGRDVRMPQPERRNPGRDPYLPHPEHEPPRNHGMNQSSLLGVLGAGILGAVQAANEAKEQQAQQEQEKIRQEQEEAKKQEALLDSLPATCPCCGAPTNRKLNCEYCGSSLLKISK